MRLLSLARRVSGHIADLRQDRFFRRLAMLSGGVAAGQLFLALSTPLLTRLYTPEDFGVFAVIVAILAMFNGVANLRLETSIPVCRAEILPAALATNFLVSAGTVLLLTLGVIATELFFFPPDIDPAIRDSVRLVPPITLLTALTQPFVYLHVRRGEFRVYGMVRMGRLVSQGVSQIALGLTGLGYLGLTLGYGVGPLFALALLLRHGAHELPSLIRVKLPDIGAYVRKHWRHPLYLMPAAVLFEAVQFLPAVLLAAVFSPAAAGFFALSQRVLGLPVRFLSQSAGQVLLGEAAQASGQEISRRVRNIARQFAFLGTAIILPMILIGSGGWEFLFGTRWGEAWIFVSALSPMYALRFVTETVANVFIITNTQHFRFASSVALLAITLFSFLTAPYLGFGPIAATVMYSLGCSIVYAAQLLVVLSLSADYGKSSGPSAKS